MATQAINELSEPSVVPTGPWPTVFRIFAWTTVSATLVFCLNTYLIFWQGFPGVTGTLADFGLLEPARDAKPLVGIDVGLGLFQIASYLLCFLGSVWFVQRGGDRTLRNDADSLSGLSAYIIRAAFWAVLFVGLADMAISFLRVEELLPLVVGEQLASDLGRSTYRGTFVHLPLMVIAVALAAFTRTLGFTWLALLVVIAELFIVLTRFVFSYEQAFQGDLVRFWYAALFLFASAYTLIEEGHVRVDVVYAGLSQKNKGLVNAIGCVVLGMSLCWTVLILGMWSKTNIIVSPLLSFEVSQSGFGMYVKYLMAGFLGVFAVSMMIQFTSYLLDSVADYRGDPGHRETDGAAAH